MKILATLPIWGDEYVGRFLRYTLPCLVAPGNLAALARDHGVLLVVFTGGQEAARLREPLERSGIDYYFLPLPERYDRRHSGTVMKEAFQRGFDIAWKGGCAFAPLCADVVYSDGFFTAAMALLKGGKRAVLTQGGVVARSAFDLERPTLHPGAPPRHLMKNFLAVTAHGKRLPKWPGYSNYPAQLFWPVGEHGLVMRACHLYPVLLLPERHAVMTWSHDNDLVERALTSLDHVAYMDDSDQGFFFGLHEDGHASAAIDRPVATIAVLEQFCREWVSPWKARYWQHDFVWHDGEMDADHLLIAKTQAARTINNLVAMWERVRHDPAPPPPSLLHRVMRRIRA